MLPVSERSYRGSRPLTKGDAVAVARVGRALQVICTVAGDVSFLMTDGSTNTVPVNVGLSILTYEVLRVLSTGTTATATFANLD